jgi:hypothetical protein
LIQELVLILDGRDGVVLALILFGASVFGSRRSLPEGFQNEHSAKPVEAADTGLFVPKSEGLSEREKRAKWLK